MRKDYRITSPPNPLSLPLLPNPFLQGEGGNFKLSLLGAERFGEGFFSFQKKVSFICSFLPWGDAGRQARGHHRQRLVIRSSVISA